MSDRVPCCIRGCRRTFRAKEAHGIEIMCGKHYRCDRALLAEFKAAKRRLQMATRRLNKIHARGKVTERWLEERWQKHAAPVRVLWDRIKQEAQRQQDAGFFAPRPRRRGELARQYVEIDKTTERISNAFEDHFQRMKGAMMR